MTEAAPFSMPSAGSTFEARGGWVAHQLAIELNLTLPQAAGIVGNLGFESGGFRKLQEIKPLAGRGGYGWAQWTGPRRRAFEAFCADHELEPSSDEANFSFLIEELTGSYAKCVEHLRNIPTLEGAVFHFGVDFERPAGTTATHLPGYDSRLSYAKRALTGAGTTAAMPKLVDVLAADMPMLAPALNPKPTPARTGGSVATATGVSTAMGQWFLYGLEHIPGFSHLSPQLEVSATVIAAAGAGWMIHRFLVR